MLGVALGLWLFGQVHGWGISVYTSIGMKACRFLILFVFYVRNNFLWNRIDFLKEHKLLPILLIWLHLGVWENVFPVQTPGFVGVKEKIFLIILFVYLPNCCQMGVTTVVVTGYCIFWFVNLTEQLHLWQILLPSVADVIATLIVFFIGCCYCQ